MVRRLDAADRRTNEGDAMVQRYVWFDDIDRVERVRTELRIPKPLHGFLLDVAKRHDVSVNALVTGILVYAASADEHKRLLIEVVPSVKVTEAKPGTPTVEVPVPLVTRDHRRPS